MTFKEYWDQNKIVLLSKGVTMHTAHRIWSAAITSAEKLTLKTLR